MDKRAPAIGVSILREVFPPTAIDSSALQAREPIGKWRIEDEISIGGIEGHTWMDFSSRQARGTWDILELLEHKCLPVILPGYLQWLQDFEEADVMVSALPALLLESLRRKPSPFSSEQLGGISKFFASALDQTQKSLTQEDRDLYLAVIRAADEGLPRESVGC